MSSSLPDRTDLDQLRRQAKELRDAARSGEPTSLQRITRLTPIRQPGSVTLAVAQFVIAQELGFASWPKLKAAVESRGRLGERAVAFVEASVAGHRRRARRLLEADPGVARVNLRTAAVLGDAGWVEHLITADPSAVSGVDNERSWPPLLYVCYSYWYRIDPSRGAGLVETARLLLDAGADPDTHNRAKPHHGYRSALHGSVIVNNPAITRLLLERGANPNDR